jgi:CspA family cold shock protein
MIQSHNRRAFLRIGMLATGVAVLAACGATAANTGLSEEERAALEAKGDEIAAAMKTDTTPREKIKGSFTYKGVVKFYNAAKGFGFILDSGTGNDIFLHNTGILEGVTLNEGDRVTFDLERGKKGMMAVDVELEQ